MAGMQSAAMTLLLPAGAASDPVDRTGAATVLADLVLRGAGSRERRDHRIGREHRFRRSKKRRRKAFWQLERPAERDDQAFAATGEFPLRRTKERADAYRHRVSIGARDASRLLHGAIGRRSAQ